MSINEYLDFKARTQAGDSGGLRVIGGQEESNRRIGRIMIIVLVVLVLIGLALAVYFLIVRRQSSSTGGSGGGGGGGNGGGGTGGGGGGGGGGNNGCQSNADCLTNQLCNTSTGICVSCLTNNDCTGSNGICNTTSGTCQECVENADCPAGNCVGSICCDASDPVITGVTTSLSNNSSFTVNYTYGQSNRPGAQVEMILRTDTGVQLTTKTAPATGSNTFTESILQLPNDLLFPQTGYQVSIRINYSCTAAASTNFTPFFSFSMGVCSALSPLGNDGITNGAASAGVGAVIWNNFVGAVIRHTDISTQYLVGIVADQNPNFHPNLASVYHPQINMDSRTIIVSDPFTGSYTLTYAWTPLPYPGPVGTTYYVREYRIGSGTCNSSPAPQLTFTRTY